MTENSAPDSGRAAELTGLLNAAPTDPTDHEAVGKYIRQLAEAGLAVMLVWPDSKLPADLRTPQRKRADDKAAQKAARDAGRRDWQRVKSAAGLTLATTDTEVLDGYLRRYVRAFADRFPDGVPVNLAVETGRSRLVVVDCDTAAQLQRFYDVALPKGASTEDRPTPTILTPGQVGAGGDAADGDTWAHRDGGHFWFTVPEDIELPTTVGTLTWPGDDGFAVLWDHRYALIPPSVRREGAYTAPGAVHDLAESGWLIEAITDYAARRVERSGQRAGEPANGNMAARIDAWAEGISWASILEPLGWTLAARADSCGCEVWTAPGPHASPKSATAHDSGCTAGRYTEINAPLHVWTDHDRAPFDAWLAERGTATLSKLQAVAAGYYDNELGAAMDDLGIEARDIDAMVPPGEELPADFGKARPLGQSSTVASDGVGKSQLEGRALHEYLTLPDEYWDAHPVLAHIRQAARASGNSPDGVIGALHAEIAARVHPNCKLDTGMKRPTPLNTYAVLADDQGGGKTTAMEEAEDLLHVTASYLDPMSNPGDLDHAVFRPGAFGSGEGIAAQYVAWLAVDLLKPKGPKRNVQVRSNVLFTVDEGESVLVELNKPTSKFGPEFRAAWSGRRLGQGNATEETRRPVPAGRYVIGACIGMQTPTLRAIQSDREHKNGTVPRLDVYWMPDPTAPDVRPAHPGPLTLDLSRFDRVIRLGDEARAAMEARALKARRGEVSSDHDRHRDLSIARRAARLAILCEAANTETSAADYGEPFIVGQAFWTLAEIEYERSARIKAYAETLSRAERREDAAGRIKAAVNRETAVDEALRSARIGREERIAGRIIRFLDKHGPTPWTGKSGIWQRAKDSSDDRGEWEQVRDGLVDDERVTVSGGVYALAISAE